MRQIITRSYFGIQSNKYQYWSFNVKYGTLDNVSRTKYNNFKLTTSAVAVNLLAFDDIDALWQDPDSFRTAVPMKLRRYQDRECC